MYLRDSIYPTPRFCPMSSWNKNVDKMRAYCKIVNYVYLFDNIFSVKCYVILYLLSRNPGTLYN